MNLFLKGSLAMMLQLAPERLTYTCAKYRAALALARSPTHAMDSA